MSWTDADIATPQQAWSDADVAEKKPEGFLTKTRKAIESVVEPVISMGANAALFPLATSAAAAADIYSRSGTPTAPIANEVFEKVQGLAFTPRSEGGRENLETIGKLFEKSKLAGLPMADLGSKSAIPAAVAAIRQQAPAAKILTQARGRTPSTVEAAQATYPGAARMTPEAKLDVANAAKMEAIEAADKYGIAIDIPDLDPGGSRLRKLADADDRFAAMSAVNKGKPEMALKTEVGIEPQRPLSLAAIDDNLERLSGPKRQIESMSGFFDDGTVVREVRSLIPERTVGMGKEHANAVAEVARIVDDVTEGVGVGSGRNIMSSVESLRKAARDIYGRDEITPELRNTANIYKGTANALERLIERRLETTSPDLLGAYRQNREVMAKTYLLRDILDDNKQTVNLKQLAKQTAQDEGVTGAFRDFAKIYANSPESFMAKPKAEKQFHASRYTYPGATGAIIGSAAFGPLGGALGAIAGTALSGKVAGAAARRLASPKHQKGYSEVLRNRGRTDLGYEPVPPPLELAPQGPLPPSSMGGTQVGTGPRDTGVVNLAPQLGAGMPSPGTGPGPLLRSGRAGPEPIYPKEGPTSIPQQTGMSREPTPQMPTVEMPLKPEMSQQFLSEMMDAMAKGDMETVARLEQQYAAAQAALESQSPHAAHDLLYEPFRRRQEMPSMPSGPSAFSEALRNFRGAQ